MALDPVTKYAKDVVSGKVLAGPYVRAAGQRHLDDLERSKKADFPYRFDIDEPHRFAAFCRECIVLEDPNPAAPSGTEIPMELLDFQWFVTGSLFGWVRKDDGRRRFSRIYWETGKGNTKSPTMAAVLLYLLTATDPYKQTHIVGAAKYDQAGEIVREMLRMVETSEPLRARVNAIGGDDPAEFRFRNRNTINRVKRVAKASDARAAGAGTSGPIVTTAVIDELHECQDDSLYVSFKAGLKNAKNGLIVLLTNSGLSMDDFCGRQHQFSVEVVEGKAQADHVFAYISALDVGDDPKDEACWPKAMPGLGVTIPLFRVREEAADAEGLPEKEGEFQRRFLCVWGTDSSENLFSLAAWKRIETAELDEEVIAGLPCFLALDLSSHADLTALSAVWVDFRGPEDFSIYGRSIPFLPEEGMLARQRLEKVPYSGYAKAGQVKLCAGPRVEYLDVARAVKDLMDRYDVRAMAYDPWKMDLMKDALTEELVRCWERPQTASKYYSRTGLELVRHPQSGTKGKSDLWPEGSIRALEEWVVNRNLMVEHNPVLRHQASSASHVYRMPGSGNRRFEKHKPNVMKNDAIVSFAFACGLAERHILAEKERSRRRGATKGAPKGYYD